MGQSWLTPRFPCCPVLEKIRSAVGSTQLLLSQKVQQFFRLCQQSMVSALGSGTFDAGCVSPTCMRLGLGAQEAESQMLCPSLPGPSRGGGLSSLIVTLNCSSFSLAVSPLSLPSLRTPLRSLCPPSRTWQVSGTSCSSPSRM